MAVNNKWIPARKSHLHYYDEIPLYYRTPSGNITLYKPAGMSFSHESLERKYAIDEFFIHPENRLESIEAAQKGFNSELRTQISNEDLGDIKTALTDLVEETLSAPRAGGLTKMPQTVEWDTAAAHAVAEGAGRACTNMDGSIMLYNKPVMRNGAFLVK